MPQYSLHEANTAVTWVRHSGMSHMDGSWPRDVDSSDPEQVARWRRKIERDEAYIKSVVRLGAIVEEIVRQNNTLDMYKVYFADIDVPELDPSTLSTVAALRFQSTTDGKIPARTNHMVRALAWCPDGSGRISASLDEILASTNESGQGLCLIFDSGSPCSPPTTLHPASPALALAYNPRDHSVLAMGTKSGQLALFDVRQQTSEAIGQTDSRAGHTDCITGLAWTQSKMNTELMTASLDGTVAWWDSRKLVERLDTVVLREKTAGQGGGAEESPTGPFLEATCLEYDAAAGPARFSVGTSHGMVLAGNRRARSPADRITTSFPGHHNEVRALCRHPFLPKYFMSVGDWTARLWSEDLRVPLTVTPYRRPYLSGGAWSSMRPSVFYSVNSEGDIEAWDLLQSQSAPVAGTSVTDCALTALASAGGPKNGLQAVGCADGTTFLVKPSSGLLRPGGDELASFSAVSGNDARACTTVKA